MQPDTPSFTATDTARARAAHQVIDRPHVFHDPIAHLFVPPPPDPAMFHRVAGPMLDAVRAYVVQNPVAFDRFRAFIALRHRYAEDAAAITCASAPHHIVILGAGLETLAYRQPAWMQRLRIVEVDHPASQAAKRRHLAEHRIAIPANVRFAPVDFETDDLGDALAALRLDPGVPVFATALGVVNYITRPAFAGMARTIGDWPVGGHLVFDLISDAMTKSAREFTAVATAAVELIGEPYLPSFEAAELSDLLNAAGLQLAERLSWAESVRRYFADRADHLTPCDSHALLHAKSAHAPSA
jgi:methyltransferase (TIGR00027 family)